MEEKSVAKLGGVCSIIVGILYVMIGVTFLLVPAEQQGGIDDIAMFLPSFHQNPIAMTLLYVEFALSAILAIAAVPAITGLVRAVNEGWARWTSNLAFLGFALVAIYYFQMIAIAPPQAAAFVAGDASTKAALVIPTGVDPQFLLRYGTIGLWMLVVSILALKGKILPTTLSAIGIIGAVLYWVFAINDALGVATVVRPILAIAGGVIAGPIWFIWIGIRLTKATS
jgi:hypothetical protein